MTQRVDICNLALSHIGAKAKIMDMSDRSAEAGHCRTFYDPALRAALAGFDWNFARRIREATPAPEGYVATGWQAAYLYPSDCLVVRAIAREHLHQKRPRWRVLLVGPDKLKTIQTERPIAHLIYTSYSADPVLHDDQFNMAFSFRLAALLSGPMSKSNSLTEAMIKQFNDHIEQAALSSANENGDMFAYGVSESSSEPDWIEAR